MRTMDEGLKDARRVVKEAIHSYPDPQTERERAVGAALEEIMRALDLVAAEVRAVKAKSERMRLL